MADIRFRILRSETKYGTELSRIIVNRYQQTRCEPYTSSVEGDANYLFYYSYILLTAIVNS